MNHIELFAGCGGLSLGLESAGFELLLANELSPMASETFAYNHLGVDLKESREAQPSHNVHWISSFFPVSDQRCRLRENPFEACGLDGKYSDLEHAVSLGNRLRRTLLIGSIVDLNCILEKDSNFLKLVKTGFGKGDVDLVSGGPPCQSFSMAGMRQHSNKRNQLPWEFARFVEKVQPKIALLENVTGILRAFNVNGKRVHAWYEVAKAFATVGYVPVCLHANAKYIGVAQNRPRFIMLALRKDVAETLFQSLKDDFFIQILDQSISFQTAISRGRKTTIDNLSYYDVEKYWHDFLQSPILLELVQHSRTKLVSVKDALDDLRSSRVKESDYVKKLNVIYKNPYNRDQNKILNHELRVNSPKVQSRFHLYQLMSRMVESDAKEVSKFLRTMDVADLSDKVLEKLLLKSYFLESGEIVKFKSKVQLREHLEFLHTKKQTQKALISSIPAPAALSIPDDACHYHKSELRTLTVREMARIQSFPDWFMFRSKVTTGGQLRKFEVPQYTQVGNAVPPLLGLALGNICKKVLNYANVR